LAILAIALVFGMTVVGCGGGGDSGGGIGIGGGGGSGGGVTIDGCTWEKPWTDSSEGGISTITRTRGSGNDSNKITLSGNLQKIPGKGWGVAGCYVTPNSANLAALKSTDSFSFKCRGDGKQYMVYVALSNVPDDNMHRKIFTTSTTDNTITVQYSELVQGWGEPIPFNKSNIIGIQFEALVWNTDEGTGEGPFNITIWDLKAGGQGGSGSGGTFTLTDIPSEYNGKYAVMANFEDGHVMGAQNISTSLVTFSRISNGSVSLPTWTRSGSNYVKYSGNETLNIWFGINDSSALASFGPGDFIKMRWFSSVVFSNGSATRSWSQGSDGTP